MIGELMQAFSHMDHETKERLRAVITEALQTRDVRGFLARKVRRMFEPDDWHYRMLGIPTSSDKATIQAAFKRLHPMLHPDRMKGSDHLFKLLEQARDKALEGF